MKQITNTEARAKIAEFVKKHTEHNPFVQHINNASFTGYSPMYIACGTTFNNEATVYVERRELFARDDERITFKVEVNYATAGARTPAEMTAVAALLSAAAQLAVLIEQFIGYACSNVVADPKDA